jgi:hypothetical protein
LVGSTLSIKDIKKTGFKPFFWAFHFGYLFSAVHRVLFCIDDNFIWCTVSKRFRNMKTNSHSQSRNDLTENDRGHWERCLALARETLNAGDEPFGSILVKHENEVIAKARNRINEINKLAHTEIELAH